MEFFFTADDETQLLIPSFTIVGPAGKVFELQNIADRLDNLYEAQSAVHETVARVLQIGRKDWDRNKAKQLIREEVDLNLLDGKTLDGFLDVYEKLGPMAACAVGHYALNATGLTQRSALARFKHATEVVHAIKPRKLGILDAFSRRMDYQRFVRYLNGVLSDYNMGRCPLNGACLSKTLDAWSESLTDRSKEDGTPVPSLGERMAAFVYRKSADQMRENRCDLDERFAQDHKSIFFHSGLEIMRWFNEKAPFRDPEGTEPDLVKLFLIELDNCDYKYTVSFDPKVKARPLVELYKDDFWIVAFEASLQQMMCGEGPLCLCYPHQPANCPYRPILQRMWYCTSPDPEWGESNWKLSQKKPQCIE